GPARSRDGMIRRMPFNFAAVQAPFRMQPGLSRLPPARPALTASNPGDRHLREKLAVLHAYPQQALCAVEGFDASSALMTLAVEAAATAAPAWFYDGADDCAAPRLGWSLRGGRPEASGPSAASEPSIGALLRALPVSQRAVALCCLAFAEDFAVVDAASGAVPWLAVCLPSRWAPETKVGRHFSTIHAPVADNAALLAASQGLLRLVTAGERWQRFVWTLSAEPRLHQHPDRAATEWPLQEQAAAAFLRSEQQIFLPITGRHQAVFAIHVDSAPLAEAVRTPAEAATLHAALASMSPAVLAYRGLAAPREQLLAWLENVAAAAPGAIAGDAGASAPGSCRAT
ncbi:MAG: DUF3445 domain-containing protein, partial [Pseudomonadota bacterium]|nr:DUF3445 domain-containing protein [Pseudomonadota bacterium]